MRWVVGKPLFFYIIATLIIIAIGQLPVVLHIFHTPEGAYYPYLDTLAPSDYYYPALIRYGMGPSWLLKIPYVIGQHQGSIIQIFFILLGKIALFSGLGPAEVFALSRVLGGIVFIAGVLYFLHQILPKEKAKWAFLFFLLAQPLPTIAGRFLNEDVGMWVWHFGEAARRVSSLPSHYSLGKGLAVLALGLFIHAVRTKRIKHALISSVVAFAAGMIYPPPVFMILFSLGVAGVVWSVITVISRKRVIPNGVRNLSRLPWKFIRIFMGMRDSLKQVERSLSASWRIGMTMGLFVLGSILPLLILRLELNKGYPWDMWQRVELGWNDPSMRFEAHYIRQLGSILFFIPFALILVVKKRFISYMNIFTIVWAFSAFLLFPFAQALSLGKFRFTEGVQIIPLAVLAMQGFEFIKEQISERFETKKARIFVNAVIMILTVNFFFFTTLTALQNTKVLWGLRTNIYMPYSEREALALLATSAPADSVVAADLYSSNFIPIFARVRTIIGFPDFFPSYKEFEKEHEIINALLQQKLTTEEVASYLRSRKVGFVYQKFLPKSHEPFYPTLFDPLFERSDVSVYQVKHEVLQ